MNLFGEFESFNECALAYGLGVNFPYMLGLIKREAYFMIFILCFFFCKFIKTQNRICVMSIELNVCLYV